uniref:Uncharacterized protein n=1 Tax=Callorhinchus milii TaxID=7868 RepID=A0A4W3HWJ5_CALMI
MVQEAGRYKSEDDLQRGKVSAKNALESLIINWLGKNQTFPTYSDTIVVCSSGTFLGCLSEFINPLF